MPKLSLSVRVAAASIVFLSVIHIIFWASLALAARLRLWREHLERDDVDGDPASVIDEVWKPLAQEQLSRRGKGEPLEHRLVRLPHVSKRSRRLMGPLQGLLVDG